MKKTIVYQYGLTLMTLSFVAWPSWTLIDGRSESLDANLLVNPNTGSEPSNFVLTGADDSFPLNDITSIAPPIVSGGSPTSAVSPALTLFGDKPEGVWNFQVRRDGASAAVSLRHDLTAPGCPIAPTDSEYESGTDYYSENNLRNPWPAGLNGEWVGEGVTLNLESVCQDGITIQGTTYRQRGFALQTPDLNYCNRLVGGRSWLTNLEDLEDCRRLASGQVPVTTLPSGYFSGCVQGVNMGLTDHNVARDFTLQDQVFNASAVCATPPLKRDCLAPVIGDWELEHQGLGLGSEVFSETETTPNVFRANDAALLLRTPLADAVASGSCGTSGLSWENLPVDAFVGDVEADLAAAETLLETRTQERDRIDSEIVFHRADYLLEAISVLSALQEMKLWARISDADQGLNDPANFLQTALVSNSATTANLFNERISTTDWDEILALLESSKFDALTNREALIDRLQVLKVSRYPEFQTTYQNTFSRVQNAVSVAPLLPSPDLVPVENDFQSAYNQWLLDRTKNYATFQSDWFSRLTTTDEALTNHAANFAQSQALLDRNNLTEMLGALPAVAGQSPLTASEALASALSAHEVSQTEALGRATILKTAVNDAKDYLTTVDVGSFDDSFLDGLESALADVNGQMQTLNADLSTTGRLGASANNFRDLFTSEVTTLLETLENQRDEALSAQIILAEVLSADADRWNDQQFLVDYAVQEVDNLRRLLSQTLADNAKTFVLDFLKQKVTHLFIERLGTNANQERFFPPNTTPVAGSYEWDLNQLRFSNEVQPILATSGRYKITLFAFDKAGNQTSKTGYITIKPGALVPQLNSDCNSRNLTLVADGVSHCNLVMTQVDRFGNTLESGTPLRLSVRDQNVNGSYNLIEGRGANFVNGIRFNDGSFRSEKHVFEWLTEGETNRLIGMRSLLPTLNVLVHESDPRLATQILAEQGLDLALQLESPLVDARGNFVSPVEVAELEAKVTFRPWLEVALSNQDGAPPSETRTVSVGESFPIFVQIAAVVAGIDLPPNFNVNVLGLEQPNLAFSNTDLLTGVDLAFRGITGSGVQSGDPGQPATIETAINSLLGISNLELEPLFVPSAAYQVDEGAAGIRNIVIPGIPLGVFAAANTLPRQLPELEVSDAFATEGNNLVFRIDLVRGVITEPLELQLAITDIETTGADYRFAAGRVYGMNPGDTGLLVEIETVNDQVMEDLDESFELSIASVSGLVGSHSDVGIGVIRDVNNDLSIRDSRSLEGARCQMVLTATRPVSSDVPLTLILGDPEDSATAVDDYVADSIDAILLSGSRRIVVPIQTNDDTEQEGEEFFTVTVLTPEALGFSSPSVEGRCYIQDDESLSENYVESLTGESIREGERGQVRVVLKTPSVGTTTLELSTQPQDPVEAVSDEDYESQTFSVTIPDGERFGSGPVPGILAQSDSVVEEDETFLVQVDSVLSGTLRRDFPTGVMTIIDDTTPTAVATVFSLSEISAAENTPEETVRLAVRLEEANQSEDDIVLDLVLVDESVSTGFTSATGGSSCSNSGVDYVAGNLRVTIAAGEDVGFTGDITICNDDVHEGPEQFTARVGSSSGPVASTSKTGRVDILDNDAPPVRVQALGASAQESEGVLRFNLDIDPPHADENGVPLVLTFRPEEQVGQAEAGIDFVVRDYEVTINVGDDSGAVEVELVNDDLFEPPESFDLVYVGQASGRAIAGATGTDGTIIDDDALPVLSIDPIDPVAEGESFVLTASLSRQPSSEVRVSFVTAETTGLANNAEAGNDFVSTTLEGTFTPESYLSVPLGEVLTIIDGNLNEPTETLALQFDQLLTGQLASNPAAVTLFILPDDPITPTLHLIAPTEDIPEGGEVLFRGFLDQDTTEDFVFRLKTENAGAERGVDFFAPDTITIDIPNGTPAGTVFEVRFPSSELAGELRGIPTFIDSFIEGDETFALVFDSVETGTFADTSARAEVTITDAPSPELFIHDALGQEGEVAEFEVQLRGVSFHHGGVVELRAVDGSAESPTDYECLNTQVRFAPNQFTPEIVRCNLNLDGVPGDNQNELTEQFTLELASVLVGQIPDDKGRLEATGYIDNRQFVDVVVEDAGVVNEDDIEAALNFRVNLHDGDVPLSVPLESSAQLLLVPESEDLALGGNRADREVDFINTSHDLLLTPGSGVGHTTTVVEVPVVSDAREEVNFAHNTFPEIRQETLMLNNHTSLPQGPVNTFSEGLGIIQDDDAFQCDDDVRVRVNDASMVEEGEQVYFDIDLDDSVCSTDITLNFQAIADSAGSLDFAAGPYSITIPRGQRRPNRGEELFIDTYADDQVEGSEKFLLEFISADPAPLVKSVERHFFRPDGSRQNGGDGIPAEAIILDSDTASGVPNLNLLEDQVVEGRSLSIIGELSEVAPTDITLEVEPTTLEAESGADFTAGRVNLSVAAGEDAGQVVIDTVDDTVVEDDESLRVYGRPVIIGVLGSITDFVTSIIFDNDQSPAVRLLDASPVREGGRLNFTLELRNSVTGNLELAPNGGLHIDAVPQLGTASAADFAVTPLELFMPGGTSSLNFSVQTFEDDEIEGPEDLTIELNASTRQPDILNLVEDLDDSAIGIINDDDDGSGATCDPTDVCCLLPSTCPVSAPTPGASIEGKALFGAALCEIAGKVSECEIGNLRDNFIGNTAVTLDIREEIVRNGYQLIRGKRAANKLDTDYLNTEGESVLNETSSGVYEVYLDHLPDNQVTFLEGEGASTVFQLGFNRDTGLVGQEGAEAEVSGTHTFVVLNARVNVVGDMAYASPNDSLGVIVLGDNRNRSVMDSQNTNALIAVKDNVKHFVGAYYTDNAFVTTIDAIGDGNQRLADAANWAGSNGVLNQQLVLTGNVLSSNTLGGASVLVPQGPGGSTNFVGDDALTQAQRLDFDFLRRYVPVRDASDVHTNSADCTRLPGETNCYANEKSFVLRLDPTLKISPPPGFQVQSTIKIR